MPEIVLPTKSKQDEIATNVLQIKDILNEDILSTQTTTLAQHPAGGPVLLDITGSGVLVAVSIVGTNTVAYQADNGEIKGVNGTSTAYERLIFINKEFTSKLKVTANHSSVQLFNVYYKLF